MACAIGTNSSYGHCLTRNTLFFVGEHLVELRL